MTTMKHIEQVLAELIAQARHDPDIDTKRVADILCSVAGAICEGSDGIKGLSELTGAFSEESIKRLSSFWN